MKRNTALAGILTTIALLAVTLTGCCKVPTPAQSQAFAALAGAWPNEAAMSERGAEAALEAGDINEAGKAVLDARREAFGQLIADLQSGGQ